MSVRPASTDDIEAVRTVARDSWEVDYPEIMSRETVDEAVDRWYSHEQVRSAVENPRMFLLVAERDTGPVGFVHAFLNGQTGVVLRLYVHPEHRGEGIGTRLFEEMRDQLFEHGVERLRAMVLAANDPGSRFYRSLGLERVDSGETTAGGESFAEHTYELQPEH
jgi:ribosomal protein S18 acetylase RimI-like enzyme